MTAVRHKFFLEFESHTSRQLQQQQQGQQPWQPIFHEIQQYIEYSTTHIASNAG
jgi:hypothetical protein